MILAVSRSLGGPAWNRLSKFLSKPCSELTSMRWNCVPGTVIERSEPLTASVTCTLLMLNGLPVALCVLRRFVTIAL